MRSNSLYRLAKIFAIVAVIAVLGLISAFFWAGGNPATTMFQVVSAIGTLMSIVFGVAGYFRQSTQTPDVPLPDAGRDPNALPAALLTKEESYAHYLAILETIVTEGICSIRRYVLLDVQAEIEKTPEAEIEPLQDFSVQEHSKIVPISLLSAHKRFRRYVLLGDPGSGKTTTLNILALRQIQQVRKDGPTTLLPFFCSLARWTDRRQSALAFLKERFVELAGPGSTLDFEQLLSGGKLLVMLDGLNEMPFRRPRWSPAQAAEMIDPNKVQLSVGEDNRERLLNDIATSQGVNSRFIVTCRTYEFSATPQWQQVFVQPMSDEQIRLFVKKYAPPRAEALWKVIEGNDA